MNSFHFSESDLTISAIALRALSDLLAEASPEHRASAVYYSNLADRLLERPSSVPANDLRHICIALKFFTEDHPLDWKAARLFSQLSSTCGFIDVVT